MKMVVICFIENNGFFIFFNRYILNFSNKKRA